MSSFILCWIDFSRWLSSCFKSICWEDFLSYCIAFAALSITYGLFLCDCFQASLCSIDYFLSLWPLFWFPGQCPKVIPPQYWLAFLWLLNELVVNFLNCHLLFTVDFIQNKLELLTKEKSGTSLQVYFISFMLGLSSLSITSNISCWIPNDFLVTKLADISLLFYLTSEAQLKYQCLPIGMVTSFTFCSLTFDLNDVCPQCSGFWSSFSNIYPDDSNHNSITFKESYRTTNQQSLLVATEFHGGFPSHFWLFVQSSTDLPSRTVRHRRLRTQLIFSLPSTVPSRT